MALMNLYESQYTAYISLTLPTYHLLYNLSPGWSVRILFIITSGFWIIRYCLIHTCLVFETAYGWIFLSSEKDDMDWGWDTIKSAVLFEPQPSLHTKILFPQGFHLIRCGCRTQWTNWQRDLILLLYSLRYLKTHE
jgi:hypothetical protein